MQLVKEMFPMRLTLSVPTNHELHKANGEAFTGEQIYCRSERVVHDRPVWEHVEGGRWLYFYFSRTPQWVFTRREGSIGQGKGAISGTVFDSIGSNLLDAEVTVKELAVSASSQPIDTDRPLWPTLAMIAFVVLLIEWWYFHRKSAGITA